MEVQTYNDETSLPDDYVHYSSPRTFSVREWARLQTFPDHHVFCGKRTTGGDRRAGNPSKGNWDREVPKYTQIGNAVPPLMAQEIGDQIVRIFLQNEFNHLGQSVRQEVAAYLEDSSLINKIEEIVDEKISEKTRKSKLIKLFEAVKVSESVGKWLIRFVKYGTGLAVSLSVPGS